LFFALCVFVSSVSAQTTIYVHPSGSGTGNGPSPSQALGTLEAARSAVRAINQTATADIVVYLRGGVYPRTSTFALNHLDGGYNGHRVTWAAYGQELPILHGGQEVTGWTSVTINGKPARKAMLAPGTLPNGLRNLYVNGERRKRASSDLILPRGFSTDPNVANSNRNGFVIDGTNFANIANPSDVEIHQQVSWRHYVLPITQIFANDNQTTTLVAPLANNLVWLSPSFVGLKSHSVIRLENALELLDEPGEFYFDRPSNTLYYYPKPGENLATSSVVIPKLDRLISVIGTAANRVRNLTFHGIQFAYTGWTKPNSDGWYGYDAGYALVDRQFGTSRSGVYVAFGTGISFEDNDFVHLGGAGLQLSDGIHNAIVRGNLFQDISADGLSAGLVHQGTEYGSNLLIENNLFHRTGQEFLMTSAVVTSPFNGAIFRNNDVIDNPYMGFLMKRFGGALGTYRNWQVLNNRFINTMGTTWDGGAIYAWGDSSDNATRSLIAGNYIQGVGSTNSQGIYLDNDARYWTVENNVVERTLSLWFLIKGSHHTLRNNFTDNPGFSYQSLHGGTVSGSNIVETGTTVVPSANWSAYPAAAAVVASAGLQSPYQGLRNYLPATPTGNATPIVNAGPNRTVALNSLLRLDATVSDDNAPYGLIKPSWRKVSGPGDVTFFGNQHQLVDAVCSFSVAGTYVLELSASDTLRSASDQVSVTVTADVTIGAELTSTLPTSAFTASASNGTGQAPSKAFDNQNGTLWYPGFPGTGWLQVDLGSPKDIARIEYTVRQGPGQDSSRKEFFFLVSNDPNFNSFMPVLGQGPDEFPADGFYPIMAIPFSGGTTSYRYVRYWKPTGFGGVVNELKIYERNAASFVQQRNPVVSSTASNNAANSAKTHDDLTSTHWQTGSVGQTLTHDLGSTRKVDLVRLVWFHPNRVYSFHIHTSVDGVAWTPVLTNAQSSATPTEWNEFSLLTPVNARYIRYVARGSTANSWTYLAEMESYETVSSSAQPVPLTAFLVDAGVPANQRASTDDPDEDGIPNELEFVLGGSPLSADTNILPTATPAPGGTSLIFTYRRKIAAAAIPQTVQYTTNLSSAWTAAVHGVDGVTIVTASLDAQTEQVTTTVPTTGGKVFARLSVGQ
jgi:hypothetical protein